MFFKFAKIQGEYYKISNRTLHIKHSVFLFVELELNTKYFINTEDGNLSVFLRINEICNEDIYIGGNHGNAIPKEDFELLVENFPTRRKTKLYAQYRILKNTWRVFVYNGRF